MADVDECLTNVLNGVTAPTSTTTSTSSTTTTTSLPGGSCTDAEPPAMVGVTAAHNDVRDSATPTRVGCGVRNCTTNAPFGPSFPNWTFVVCSYDPAGNRPYWATFR